MQEDLPDEHNPRSLQGLPSMMDSSLHVSTPPLVLLTVWSRWSELANLNLLGDSLEQRKTVVRANDLFLSELLGASGSKWFILPLWGNKLLFTILWPARRANLSWLRESRSSGSSPINQKVKRSPFPFIETRPRSARLKPPSWSNNIFVSKLQWILKAEVW